jgi:Ankyrin repeats (3 copies)
MSHILQASPKISTKIPRIPLNLPYEIKEMILMHLDAYTIRMIGEETVQPYVWIRKKHETVIEAARNNNLIGLKYLIEERHLCNKDDNDKALCISAEHGYLEIVKYLIEKCDAASKNRIIRRFHKLLINYLFFIY